MQDFPVCALPRCKWPEDVIGMGFSTIGARGVLEHTPTMKRQDAPLCDDPLCAECRRFRPDRFGVVLTRHDWEDARSLSRWFEVLGLPPEPLSWLAHRAHHQPEIARLERLGKDLAIASKRKGYG